MDFRILHIILDLLLLKHFRFSTLYKIMPINLIPSNGVFMSSLKVYSDIYIYIIFSIISSLRKRQTCWYYFYMNSFLDRRKGDEFLAEAEVLLLLKM